MLRTPFRAVWHVLKNIWRDELIDTPKYCSADTPAAECMWTCVENFSEHPALHKITAENWKLTPEDEHYHEVVTKAICETPFWPGDHLEAASTVEASFWPIHPTLDRLIQYKDMVTPFKNMDWATLSRSSTCTSSNTDCKGHNAFDPTYFVSTVKDLSTGGFEKSHLTNAEMRNAVNPSKEYYRMPYLYNHFEWKHCADFDFKSVEDIDASSRMQYLGVS